ncbi:MAG TPA: hypothetical protein DDW78_08730 [Treponema sp.]|nr:hypothetical protein [Treponema sp.]
MRGSGKTPGLPFAKRSVQQAVRVFFRWERIFVFMLNPWQAPPFPHIFPVLHPVFLQHGSKKMRPG